MTTDYEQEQRDRGNKEILSLTEEAVKVDALFLQLAFL